MQNEKNNKNNNWPFKDEIFEALKYITMLFCTNHVLKLGNENLKKIATFFSTFHKSFFRSRRSK